MKQTFNKHQNILYNYREYKFTLNILFFFAKIGMVLKICIVFVPIIVFALVVFVYVLNRK